MKPITDGAEVSVDFPDKAYIGSFGRSSGFEVKVKSDEAVLRLIRTGDERREAALHIHYYLLSSILSELADGLAAMPPLDDAHREPLQDAAKALEKSLRKRRPA